MLYDELKKLGNPLKHKKKNSNKQQKHSGVLISDEIKKKLERLNHFFFAFRTHDDNSGLYKKVHQTRNDKNWLP